MAVICRGDNSNNVRHMNLVWLSQRTWRELTVALRHSNPRKAALGRPRRGSKVSIGSPRLEMPFKRSMTITYPVLPFLNTGFGITK